MAVSIHPSSFPKAPPPNLVKSTTFVLPRCALFTAAQRVASYADSNTSDAKDCQWVRGTSL